MKHVLILLAVLLSGLVAGCRTPGAPAAATPAATLGAARQVVLTVHGLSCPLCASNLDGQLKRIPGVEAATIDLKTGAVTVNLAANHLVLRSDFQKAVDAAGFTLKDIRPVSP